MIGCVDIINVVNLMNVRDFIFLLINTFCKELWNVKAIECESL